MMKTEAQSHADTKRRRVYRKIVAIEARHIGGRPTFKVIPHHVLACGHAIPVREPRSRREAIAAMTLTKRHCYYCARAQRETPSQEGNQTCLR